MTRLVDSLARKDLPECLCENAQVERERLIVDVPHVLRQPLFPGDCVPAVNLGPACDPWPHVVATLLFRRVAVEILHQKRARTDEAHISLDHVDQFRQFIDARRSKKLAKRVQAIGVGPHLPASRAVVGHCPELYQGEGPASKTGPFLKKEDGRARFDQYQ